MCPTFCLSSEEPGYLSRKIQDSLPHKTERITQEVYI